jgi:hypothetical protein
LPTWKGYVAALASSTASGGTIPITEGSKPPCTGTAQIAQAATDSANAARLDIAFVSLGITDKLVTFGLGNQNQVPNNATASSDLLWSGKYRAFFMDDGSGGVSATATALRDWSNCSRLEARVSNPVGFPNPSAALGANFKLNGTTSITANTIIAYAVLKDVPYKDAIELSKAINGEDLTTATENGTVAQDNGAVVFAAPAGPTVDVYVYISSI